MNEITRVRRVLAGKIPDRVPKGEFKVSDTIARAIAGKSGFEGKLETVRTLGFDFIAPALNYKYKNTANFDSKGNEIYSDPWGRKTVFYNETPVVLDFPCSELDDIIKLKLPSDDKFSWTEVILWKENSSLFVFALIDGIFQTLSSLMPFEKFLLATVKERIKLRPVIDKMASFIIEVAHRAIKAGADGIILGDDIAYNSGTFLHPAILQDYFFPGLERVIRSLPVPVIFHSDGNIKNILTSLADTGIKGIHSLEPSSGIDLKEVKKEIGTRLTLIGNLDFTSLYRFSPTQISEHVKNIIQIGAPGGRYMFSSSSGVLDDITADKAVAIYNAVETHGIY